jgi:hypothetical protein
MVKRKWADQLDGFFMPHDQDKVRFFHDKISEKLSDILLPGEEVVWWEAPGGYPISKELIFWLSVAIFIVGAAVNTSMILPIASISVFCFLAWVYFEGKNAKETAVFILVTLLVIRMLGVRTADNSLWPEFIICICIALVFLLTQKTEHKMRDAAIYIMTTQRAIVVSKNDDVNIINPKDMSLYEIILNKNGTATLYFLREVVPQGEHTSIEGTGFYNITRFKAAEKALLNVLGKRRNGADRHTDASAIRAMPVSESGAASLELLGLEPRVRKFIQMELMPDERVRWFGRPVYFSCVKREILDEIKHALIISAIMYFIVSVMYLMGFYAEGKYDFLVPMGPLLFGILFFPLSWSRLSDGCKSVYVVTSDRAMIVKPKRGVQSFFPRDLNNVGLKKSDAQIYEVSLYKATLNSPSGQRERESFSFADLEDGEDAEAALQLLLELKARTQSESEESQPNLYSTPNPPRG